MTHATYTRKKFEGSLTDWCFVCNEPAPCKDGTIERLEAENTAMRALLLRHIANSEAHGLRRIERDSERINIWMEARRLLGITLSEEELKRIYAEADATPRPPEWGEPYSTLAERMMDPEGASAHLGMDDAEGSATVEKR